MSGIRPIRRHPGASSQHVDHTEGALCDSTHSPVRRKPEWDRMVGGSVEGVALALGLATPVIIHGKDS